MEIQDMEGKKIVSLSPGKSKGVNIVNWNYRLKAPKVAKGKTFSFGGFTAPRVEAGTYKAVIKKGKDTYTHEFELKYDERTGLSAADRKLKHDTTMKLYDMTQDLAYMVYQLDETEKNITNKKLSAELQELKKTLVVTTGDNYVGSAEPQLREKMADLYSKIASSYDKPTQEDLDNLKVIEERFNKAEKDFSKLKKKAKTDQLNLKTFDEFIDE
jgi:hypothetical protein